jgi:hypothetical protein
MARIWNLQAATLERAHGSERPVTSTTIDPPGRLLLLPHTGRSRGVARRGIAVESRRGANRVGVDGEYTLRETLTERKRSFSGREIAGGGDVIGERVRRK